MPTLAEQLAARRKGAGVVAGPPLTRGLYAALHGIASKLMRSERPDCPLQSTILVHDAYIALSRQRNLEACDQPTLLAAAALIMRRLLVDSARACRRQKRGGKKVKQFLPPSLTRDANTIADVELRDALDALRAHCETTARIVELRFFGGLTHAEIAEKTGLCERTVGERWRFAKAWLHRAIRCEGAARA
jgi:RNA polymerase sigma factor (TIGR02999 family)